MKLTQDQREDLSTALLDAFPTKGDLETMLLIRTDTHLDQVALGDNLTQIVMRLIRAAEAKNWHLRLIEGAHAEAPDNSLLTRIYERVFSLPSRTDRARTLEKIVRARSPLLDFTRFSEGLNQRARCVCRVDVDGQAQGTGFLVGPDVVLTNHHVIQRIAATRISLLFDERSPAQGSSSNATKRYPLSKSWFLAGAPSSPVDELLDAKGQVPDPEHLDFALLRVQGRPGEEPLSTGGTRGWIPLPESAPDFFPGEPLCILQHPRGEPLRLAIEPDAVLGLNENATRLRYRINTLGGSSGSPCFDFSWNLVALHHSGDPADEATYNEGIPIHTLRKHLIEKGLGSLIGVGG